MTIEDTYTPPAATIDATEPARAPTVLPLTKNQLKSSSMADAAAVKAKWKLLVADAKTTWPKVHVEELAKVDGNIHKLSGLVQMRHQFSREETDRQVKDFFGKHYAAA